MNLFMKRALEVAQSVEDDVPIGAVIIVEDQIVAEGKNHRRMSQKTMAHAEMMALEEYNKKFSNWRFYPGAKLFVTVEPCLMCVGALLWARVDEIYYGCPDPNNAGLRRILPLIEEGVFDHRFKKVEGGMMADEASKLVSNYFSSLRKQK